MSFENVDHDDIGQMDGWMDRQVTGAYLHYKLTYEPSAQVS